MIFLWDTDTFSWWQRRPDLFQKRLDELADDDAVMLSAVTVFEAVRGRVTVVAQARGEKTYARSLRALLETVTATQRWPALPYTPEATDQFMLLRSGRGSRGAPDLRIAAIALVAGAVLVTRNAADFAGIPGLEIENWVD